MTWDILNVTSNFCAGNTAVKLAWNILNELVMSQASVGWVLCPCPCNVFAMFLPGTPPPAPSEYVPSDQLGSGYAVEQRANVVLDTRDEILIVWAWYALGVTEGDGHSNGSGDVAS